MKNLYRMGYNPSFIHLQKSNNINMLFLKKDKKRGNENSADVFNYVRLNEEGKPTASRLESVKQGNDTLERAHIFRGDYSLLSYYDDSKAPLRKLKKELRLVSKGFYPVGIYETYQSPIMREAYDSRFYPLEGIDEDVDVVEKIEKGELEGVPICQTYVLPNGEKTHIDEFQRGEYHTRREYKESKDKSKTSLSYTIENLEGEKILDIKRSFEQKGNTSVSIVNGRKFVADFDDKNLIIKVQSDWQEKTIDIKEKISKNPYVDGARLFEILKLMPPDAILGLHNIKKIEINDNRGYWRMQDGGMISMCAKLSVLGHELGHYMDMSNNGLNKMTSLDKKYRTQRIPVKHFVSGNYELIKIYNEEMEELKKDVTECELKTIGYFGQNSSSAASGLGEFVAEAYLLFMMQQSEDLSERTMNLMRYFPRTLAKTAELLGYKTVCKE